MAVLAACGTASPPQLTDAGAAPPAPVGPPPIAPHRCAAGVPGAACTEPGVHLCRPGDRDRIGEWRFALISAPFDPTESITRAELIDAWRAGAVQATDDTAAALAEVLGPRPDRARLAADQRPALDAGHRAIVAAHDLRPAWTVIAVDQQHPLAPATDGPLIVPLCGPAGPPIRNIDPARLTTLVMSGTTALTGRTAERLDTSGIADTVRYIRPFFASADLVHVSNEVAFVRDCHPRTGQRELKFCAREAYVGVLVALRVRLIELTGSHLVDYGPRALERTLDTYQRHGWIWFGGGRTQLDATTPRLVEDHGNRLGFVGCNAVNWWVGAISPGPGVAHCDWPRMIWQIQDLRRRGYLPIATVQHRELRHHAPPPDLVHDLRQLAEAGAVFVLGSQAHVAHPWDVHFGAYVHYGPGNILFAQYREAQREATVDKLYIHAGALLTVDHIHTRTEHGQPRLLTTSERARFLGQLAAAAAAIAPPDPDGVPALPAASRARPDSLVIRGHSQPFIVTAPVALVAGARYPLIVEGPATDGAFAVARIGAARVATDAEIARFMIAKYPIDPGRIDLPAAQVALRPRHHHHAQVRSSR
jgi:poly-gamma-glutamate synthesis protein (capsule biosynthesis protein)